MTRTLTIKKGGTDYSPGWKNVTISNAKYGTYEGSKYIDIWFKDYPENLNMRVYEKIGKDGEEFAIGQLFRFANAGITGSLDGTDGTTKVIKIDDSPDSLVNKTVNAYFYKDGKYSRILKQTAPTEFTNDIESFTDSDVEYWKGRAEKYYLDYVADKDSEERTVQTPIGSVSVDSNLTDLKTMTEDTSEPSTSSNDAEIPF